MMRLVQNPLFFSGYIIILAQRINIYYMTNKLKKRIYGFFRGVFYYAECFF